MAAGIKVPNVCQPVLKPQFLISGCFISVPPERVEEKKGLENEFSKTSRMLRKFVVSLFEQKIGLHISSV